MGKRKKKILPVAILLVASVPFLAGAENVSSQNNSSSQGVGNSNNTEKTVVEESTISGNQVQNQVQTQNAGEEQQLQVNTEEALEAGKEPGESYQGKSEIHSINQRSIIDEKIEALLSDESIQGKIGRQVKEIAVQQQQSQKIIEEGLGKIEARQGLIKKIFGTDSEALENLKRQLEQNRAMTRELQGLQAQVTDQADRDQIQGTIQVLEEQNLALESQIQTEEQNKGWFDWLLKIFGN